MLNPLGDLHVTLNEQNVCKMASIYRPVGRGGGGGGFEVVRSNPPFGLKDFIYTVLTVHFKCPTVGKWSTSSLASIEKHRCPRKAGCSRCDDARKYVRK